MNTPLDELPLPKYKKQTDVLKKQKEERIVSDYLDQILSKQWITDYFITPLNNTSPKKSIRSIKSI